MSENEIDKQDPGYVKAQAAVAVAIAEAETGRAVSADDAIALGYRRHADAVIEALVALETDPGPFDPADPDLFPEATGECVNPDHADRDVHPAEPDCAVDGVIVPEEGLTPLAELEANAEEKVDPEALDGVGENPVIPAEEPAPKAKRGKATGG